jgi:alanine racemase
MLDTNTLQTWIELSRSAYHHNLAFFKNLVQPPAILATVLKANAYGHGLPEMARLATEFGISWFCVHSLVEAEQIRNLGHTQPILILGPVPRANLEAVFDLSEIRLVAYTPEHIQCLQQLASAKRIQVPIHLKLETGTNRQGIANKDFHDTLELLKSCPNLLVEAVYSHFANVEDTTNHDFAEYQFNKFKHMISEIPIDDFPHVKKHMASSAAALVFKNVHFDMVRLGISQYGFWPSKETYLSYRHEYGVDAANGLQPVLTWKTRVVQIKQVDAGETVGYGCTFQTTRPSRLAVLPIGYSDGYDRGLSNQAHVLIKGMRAPVRGRIAMNLTVVDISDIPDVALEEEVVLLGSQGNQTIHAQYLADLAHTIHYEFISRIERNIPRMIVA